MVQDMQAQMGCTKAAEPDELYRRAGLNGLHMGEARLDIYDIKCKSLTCASVRLRWKRLRRA